GAITKWSKRWGCIGTVWIWYGYSYLHSFTWFKTSINGTRSKISYFQRAYTIQFQRIENLGGPAPAHHSDHRGGHLGHHQAQGADPQLPVGHESAQLDLYHPDPGQGLLHRLGLYAPSGREDRPEKGHRLDPGVLDLLSDLYPALRGGLCIQYFARGLCGLGFLRKY